MEIPSISLKTGLVDFKSSENNVNKRVQIIAGSQMPNIKKGNLILAAHSGTSNISYFKNLYKMQEGNESWLRKFYNSVIELSNKLTVFEATYFIDTFFGGRTKTSIAYKIGITRQTLRSITKSCLVKAFFEFRYLYEE